MKSGIIMGLLFAAFTAQAASESKLLFVCNSLQARGAHDKAKTSYTVTVEDGVSHHPFGAPPSVPDSVSYEVRVERSEGQALVFDGHGTVYSAGADLTLLEDGDMATGKLEIQTSYGSLVLGQLKLTTEKSPVILICGRPE
jgi:hypothetical protein